MEQKLWRRAEELFHAALELAPHARAVFLGEACGEDEDLRRELELLVSKDRQGSSLLKNPVLADVAALVATRGALVGLQFGTYRIESLLGAAGMGEVYRAHDTKLDRDVAIKTLPNEFARDPKRLARFRQEARTLAALNHPNIAAIYGLEVSGDLDCLAMELVDGEILHGPLPIPIALDRACQLAEALEAAHGHGIIHRDLKPANVKVTAQGRVKVLDFGLSKAIWRKDANPDLSPCAMGLDTGTIAGHILGTPGYMSPEQGRGEEVDQRTDIWGFGCLLYELLTGKRAVRADNGEEVSRAIAENGPDWRALPSETPAKIRKLLRECLEKNVDRRLTHIVDACRVIEEVQHRRSKWPIAAIAAAILAGFTIVLALQLLGPTRPRDRSDWVQLTKFPDPVSQPALSPDGRRLAFVRSPSTLFAVGQIYVKELPNGEPVQLTHDRLKKMAPASSPDGARIAYTVVDPLFHWDTWLVPARGGEPRPWLRNAAELIWTDPHELLFSEPRGNPHMEIVRNGRDPQDRA